MQHNAVRPMLMKLISLAFVILFVFAHAMDDFAAAIARPLSVFRDTGTLGYWLFGLLLAAGTLQVVLLIRVRWLLDAAILTAAAVLLGVVAATASTDADHQSLAFVLLGLLFVYYAWVFHRAECWWFWVHLTVPVLLASVTRLHSYGLWQKSLIVYFLLALNAQHHEVSRWLHNAKRSGPRGFDLPKKDPQKRQSVYTLDD